jgi:hypothetical protein
MLPLRSRNGDAREDSETSAHPTLSDAGAVFYNKPLRQHCLVKFVPVVQIVQVHRILRR